eukprot:jgi/Bigna1/147299/aug1.139_g22007
MSLKKYTLKNDATEDDRYLLSAGVQAAQIRQQRAGELLPLSLSNIPLTTCCSKGFSATASYMIKSFKNSTLGTRSFAVAFCTLLLTGVLIFACSVIWTLSIDLKQRFPENGSIVEQPSRQDLFEEISEEVIPGLEDFFYRRETADLLNIAGSNRSMLTPAQKINCTGIVYQKYIEATRLRLGGNSTMTIFSNPTVINEILNSLDLKEHESIVNLMRPWLEEPQPIKSVIELSRQCVADNVYLAEAACILAEDPGLLQFYEGLDQVHILYLNYGVVLEVLTRESVNSSIFRHQVFHHLVTRFWVSSLENLGRGEGRRRNEEFRNFIAQKLNSIFQLMRETMDDRTSTYNPRAKVASLHLNIAEAGAIEVADGLDENAMASLLLNYNVNNLYRQNFVADVDWPLGKDWTDMYISWNSAYVARFQRSLFAITLLIPSVVCTGHSRDAEDWIAARVMSLGLSLAFRFGKENNIFQASELDFEYPLSLMKKMGRRNLEVTSQFVAVQSDTDWKDMFKSLYPDRDVKSWWFSDTSPLDRLGGTQFELFVMGVVTITIIMTGLGMELQIGSRIIDYVSKNNKKTWLWPLAQFFFPFFTTIAIVSQSVFSFPFLVLGLWKFGFPETVAYTHDAERLLRKNQVLAATPAIFNALGTFLHHSASAYVVVGLSIRTYELTKELTSILFVLVIQHWFAILKYIHYNAYIIVEFLLDIWFHWEWFSHFEHFIREHEERYDAVGPGIAVCMLLSHWFFILAVCFEIFNSRVNISYLRSNKKIEEVKGNHYNGERLDASSRRQHRRHIRSSSYGIDSFLESPHQISELRTRFRARTMSMGGFVPNDTKLKVPHDPTASAPSLIPQQLLPSPRQAGHRIGSPNRMHNDSCRTKSQQFTPLPSSMLLLQVASLNEGAKDPLQPQEPKDEQSVSRKKILPSKNNQLERMSTEQSISQNKHRNSSNEDDGIRSSSPQIPSEKKDQYFLRKKRVDSDSPESQRTRRSSTQNRFRTSSRTRTPPGSARQSAQKKNNNPIMGKSSHSNSIGNGNDNHSQLKTDNSNPIMGQSSHINSIENGNENHPQLDNNYETESSWGHV